MKKSIALAAIILMAAFISVSQAERPGAAQSQNYLPGVVIFKMKAQPSIDSKSAATGQSKVDAVLSSAGCSSVRQIFPHKARESSQAERSLGRICEARLPIVADIKELCSKLRATGQVAYAEPRYIEQPHFTPNDPKFTDGTQWFLNKILAPAAWGITQGDTSVVIGIVDTGVDWDHPDLAANIWLNAIEYSGTAGVDDDDNGYVDDIRGWDFGYNDNNPMEDAPTHGTHVAGCASEVTNNGLGGAGIGFKSRLMALKGQSASGLTHVYDGIVYAADMGAQVINCSWGSGGASQFANEIIQYAFGKGCIIISSAGNGGADNIGDDNDAIPHYPSDYENVVCVAASNSSDIKTGFSNYGKVIDVIAPGQTIYSTWQNNTYLTTDGTSMSSPITAGVAALVRAVRPSWSTTTIATHLNMTGDNIDYLNPTYAGKIGRRLNAYRAVTEPAQPLVKYRSHYTTDGGNNIPEAGETVALAIALKNWWGDAAAVNATIHSDDYAVQIISNSGSYGAINGGYADTVATFSFTVDNTALPHWAMFTIDITADAQNRTDTFYVQIERSPILLVDDDTGARNVDTCYTKSISKLGYFFDHYDHSQKGAPDTALLNSYNAVIWLCEWAFPALDSMDRTALRNYLDNGGNLYLSGQDIGWDLADPAGTQYSAEALAFYQDYLHATYGGDHSGITSILGTASDPIGNGLAFSILQPYIGSDQYYDYFSPRAGADAIMDYSGFALGKAGIKYSGIYKVVYTGFGFEAITSESVKDTVMNRIINWFMGDIQIAHTPLTDTEDTLSPYVVQATVSSSAGVAQVYLYWDDDGTLPFANRTLMTDMGGGLYQGSIPAHSNTQIDYFIYAANSNDLNKTLPGGAPYNYYSFYAGPDPYAPAIAHTPLANTINLSGPYRVNAVITDNYGVFPDSGYIHYKVNSGSEYEPVQMASAGSDFSENITLPAHIYTGDTVYYYITAVDQSSQRNIGRSPSSDYHSFVMVDSVLVTNFDSPAMLAVFDTSIGANSWRTYTSSPHSLPNCMRTGLASCPPNAEFIMMLKPEYSFNFDPYADNNNWVKLYWWFKSFINSTPGDTAFVEASKDGISWTTFKYRISPNVIPWTLDSIDITPLFSSKGTNDSIVFRFRMKTDAVNSSVGWMVDDVYLKVKPFPSGVAGTPNEMAIRVFSLDQNRPNPFKGQTAIKYQLPSENRVRINIYNISGQLVKTLVDAKQLPGYYNIAWNGRDNSGRLVSAGVYFYRLNAGDINLTKKMVLLK